MSNTEIEYIFVSDLEGCIDKNPFKEEEDLQLKSLCDPEFFKALDAKISNNDNIHVCFLGDYFDNGDKFMQSVINIAILKQKHGEKVHILLGNRDLNKFRIFYELKLSEDDFEDSKEKFEEFGMSDWDKAFYENKEAENEETKIEKLTFINIDEKEKVKKLLKHTMDAKYDHSDDEIKALIEAFNPVNFNNNDDIDTEEYTSEKSEKLFKTAVKKIFKDGNIVEWIDGQKLLLSHGGGYSNSIYKKKLELPGSSEGKYFEKLKSAFDLINVEAQNEASDIADIVASHNNIYREFINNFKDSTETPSDEYFMIQAMGLKPKDSKDFMSFIETTPHNADADGGNIKLKEGVTLPDGIKAVSYGHESSNLNHPLVFKKNNITFIGNDTSNTGRSKKALGQDGNEEIGIPLISYSSGKVYYYQYRQCKSKLSSRKELASIPEEPKKIDSLTTKIQDEEPAAATEVDGNVDDGAEGQPSTEGAQGAEGAEGAEAPVDGAEGGKSKSIFSFFTGGKKRKTNKKTNKKKRKTKKKKGKRKGGTKKLNTTHKK